MQRHVFKPKVTGVSNILWPFIKAIYPSIIQFFSASPERSPVCCRANFVWHYFALVTKPVLVGKKQTKQTKATDTNYNAHPNAYN